MFHNVSALFIFILIMSICNNSGGGSGESHALSIFAYFEAAYYLLATVVISFVIGIFLSLINSLDQPKTKDTKSKDTSPKKQRAKSGPAKKPTRQEIEFNRIKKKAEQGDLEAMFKLGNMLYAGDGVNTDKAKGFEWLIKAADSGHKGASDIINGERSENSAEIVRNNPKRSNRKKKAKVLRKASE